MFYHHRYRYRYRKVSVSFSSIGIGIGIVKIQKVYSPNHNVHICMLVFITVGTSLDISMDHLFICVDILDTNAGLRKMTAVQE